MGGGERVLKNSARALRNRGHDIEILTLNTDGHMRAIWRYEESEWEGMRVIRWPALNLTPATRQGLDLWLSKLQNRLFPHNYVVKYFYKPGFVRLAQGFDIVQLHNDIEVGFLWLLRHLQLPRVLWCHTLDVTWENHYRHHRLTRDILRGAADLFLTGCTSTLAALEALGIPAARRGTVHYGVDEKKFHPRLDLKEPRTLLFVGGLTHHKGALLLLQALRYFKRPARVRLLTLSRDPLYAERFHRALETEQARGFHEIEHALDMRDPERLVRAYQSATVFATPSIQSVFELVNLEALSCGTPVVASHVGGFPDLIRDGENGFLVPPGEPEALASRLETVLDDLDLALRLGAAGRETILRDFTWTRVAEKLEAHYTRLLSLSSAVPDAWPAQAPKANNEASF
jgi:glycosyltransferase involved in cell wall biosynthesis